MHVTIIGGGVVGLTSAYQMARDGAEVTLVDARPTGRGASEVNAGWICPAEAAPVPAPGMIGQALRWMLRRDSPLYVRPSLEPSFVSFMLQMARHCNTTDFRSGMEALIRLSEGTMELLDGYRDDGIPFEMHSDGLLMAFLSAEKLADHRRDIDIAESSGLEPRVLIGDAVREHEPALSDAVHSGVFYPFERHLDPAALARSLRRRCLELGVEIVESTPIDRVEVSSTRATAVFARTTRFTADAYLLAAGAWSGPLSKRFGFSLPVRPGKGYSVDLPRFELRSPTYLTEAKVAATPLDQRLRLAGTMEFGRLDESIDPVRVGAIARAPQSFFRAWKMTTRPEVGAGMRPMSPDGLPIIGRLGELSNFYVSTGHAMLGLTLAPSSAVAVSDLILHGRRVPVLDRFSPQRFRRRVRRRWRPAPM